MYETSQKVLQNLCLSLLNLTHVTLGKLIDIVYADYFKVAIFQKKTVKKNASFTNFWLVGSIN